MKRRTFVGSCFAAGAGVLLGRSTDAAAFGETPDASRDAVVPEELRASSVLEVFLLGGVSQHESFYVVEEFGASAQAPTHWYASLDSGDVDASLEGCDFPSGTPLLEPFGEDAAGRTVHLGPYALPLRERPDILSRTRLVVTAHEAAPHEVAVPLALSGRIPGNPELSGMGAHVERFFAERGNASPSSVVLSPPSAIQRELTRAASSTGRHPGSSRPLQIRMDAAADTLELMRRTRLGGRASAHDDVVAALSARAEARLGGAGNYRAPAFDNHRAASEALRGASSVADLLGTSWLDEPAGEICGATAAFDATAVSFELARHLLTHPQKPLRYVCLVDGGFGAQTNAGGYDSHERNAVIQAKNLMSSLRALCSIINRPGENDPAKIDLDRTMVVLNTEFGRTAGIEGNRGRGHWPLGYPVVFIGGPTRTDRRIQGSIGADGRAQGAIRPVHHRIALLQSMGIWPFDRDAFNVSDVDGAGAGTDAAAQVLDSVLGISS